MNHSSPFQLARRACLLIVLVALSVGCGSPTTATPSDSDQEQDATVAKAGGLKSEPQSGASAPDGDEITSRPPDDAASARARDDAALDRKEAAGGVALRGRVLFDGPKPERREINMTKDPTCIKLHGDKPVLSEELIVGDDGGVQNVFVYIRRGAPKVEYPVPDEVIELDQKDCMYRPRVQGMRVGQMLRVLNNDPVTHNVRSYPVRNRAFNFGQPAESGPRDRVFDSPEREIEIQCDIHPWMHAYLFVMEHPFFAVTDDNGNYSIADLPAGDYSLAIWHEQLGKQQRDVTVAEHDAVDINFTYKP